MATITQFTAPDLSLKSILVAVDFARVSKATVSHAAALARLYSAELYVVHVVSADQFDPLRPRTEVVQDAWCDMHEVERTIIDGGFRREFPYHLIVREGDIWKHLRDVIEREEIDLVVLGARSQGSARPRGLGNVAEQVFRYARCNVLTFRESAVPPERMRRLVYPTDLTDASLAALPEAIAIANHHLAQLVLLRVPGSALANRKNFLEKVATILTTYVPAVKPDGYEIFADPVNSILKVAEDADANGIIMSSHRDDRLEHAESWWSTAYQIACGARCPVLSYRYSQRELLFK